MILELPSKPIKPEQVNPKRLILFGNPKSGKSESLSRLENNLILDLESGSGFITGLKIDVLKIASDNEITPINALKIVINKIKEGNQQNKGFLYKYITVDTVSMLEEKYALELALKLYLNTTVGRNFQGTDVRTLPNGAGWQYLKDAVQIVLDELETLCETLIVSGHTKEKLYEKDGKESSARCLDLAGKLPAILCAKADAIAFIYRKGNQTIANFKSSEDLIVGARPEHLKNQEIVLLESDDQGNFTSHWDKIFK